MARSDANELVAHVTELERRDTVVARALDAVETLAARSSGLRSRAADMRAALERIPGELRELAERNARAQTDHDAARAALEQARARLESLEAGRRRREEEVNRARSEVETLRDALTDAESQLARLRDREALLRAERETLERESFEALDSASAVAADLRQVDGIAAGAKRDPGATLTELEDWAAEVRSALFVLRGTLETQRERIVLEANALGSAVLGEPLGGSSVAVIRRRVEQTLASR